MNEQRKHAYVVGYSHDRNCVYGREDHGRQQRLLDPLTLKAARNLLRHFPSVGQEVTLYKLVPIEKRKVTDEDHRRWIAKGKRERAAAQRRSA